MKKILITGGCGFIGANLISYLINKRGVSIRVFDNESLGEYEHIKDFNVEFIRGDLLDKDELKKAMMGVDAIVHLAADTRVIDSIENPEHNFNNNVKGSLNLLNNMRELGIKRLVNASTGGAILGEVKPPVNEDMVPRPIAPYGASKLAVEGYCSAYSGAYDIKATSVRFSNVYGPRSYHKGSVIAHFFKKILKEEQLIVYGDGSQKRDYVYVDDICEGIWLSINSEKIGVYQLGTGIPTSINELIQLMKIATGNDNKIKVEYRDFRSGEIRNTYPDIKKAKSMLQYHPKIRLEKGLEITWEWFLKYYKGNQ